MYVYGDFINEQAGVSGDGKALKQSKERWPFLLKLTICGDLAEI